MCSTPAPPLTAVGAASIWSGTGEVKTSPGQAASSIPYPTKPPCSGSWPEPPPETRPTLPGVGPPARVITLFSTSTDSDGCAAATPSRASVTTVSGLLMSFFMTVLPWLSGPGLLGYRIGIGREAGHRGVGTDPADEDVGEAAEHAADDLADDVRGHLRPGDGAAEPALHEHGAQVTRGVDGRAGGRAEDDDDREHDRADGHRRPAGHGPVVDHPEDHEDHLGPGRDHPGGGGRAGAHEHEERGPERLGEELLRSGGWSCHAVRPRPRPGRLTSFGEGEPARNVFDIVE